MWRGRSLPDGGVVPVDEVLGPANRTFNAVHMSKAADRQPLLTARKPTARRELLVDREHLHGLDCETPADRPGDEVVDRHDVLSVGARGQSRNDDRACSLSRRDEVVFAQSSQRFADGIATDGKTLTQIIFGRELRSHRIHATDDLFLQRARDLQIQRIVRFGIGRRGAVRLAALPRCIFAADSSSRIDYRALAATQPALLSTATAN